MPALIFRGETYRPRVATTVRDRSVVRAYKAYHEFYHVDADNGAWHSIVGANPGWASTEVVTGWTVYQDNYGACDSSGDHVHQFQKDGAWVWSILWDNYSSGDVADDYIDPWFHSHSQSELHFTENCC